MMRQLISNVQRRCRTTIVQLRYHFDNGVAQGPVVFIVTLGILGVVAALVITLLGWLVGAFGDDSIGAVLTTGLWDRLDSILFNSAVPDGSLAVRLVWALQWIPTITISATIIAFVTTTMTRRLERLKNGTSPVIESGHILVLGWSNRIFPIVQQLALASGGRRRLVVHPRRTAAGGGPHADRGLGRLGVGGHRAVAGELVDGDLQRDGVHVVGLHGVDAVHRREREGVGLVEGPQRTEVEDGAEVDPEGVGALTREDLPSAGQGVHRLGGDCGGVEKHLG